MSKLVVCSYSVACTCKDCAHHGSHPENVQCPDGHCAVPGKVVACKVLKD